MSTTPLAMAVNNILTYETISNHFVGQVHLAPVASPAAELTGSHRPYPRRPNSLSQTDD
jgi:hypothetical protein